MAYARGLGLAVAPEPTVRVPVPALAPGGPQRRVPPEPTVRLPYLLNVPAHPIAPTPKAPDLFARARAALQARRVIPPQTTTHVGPTMGALAVSPAPVVPAAYGVPVQLTTQLNAADQQAAAIAAANPSNPLAQQYAAFVEQNASDVGNIAADVGSAQFVAGVTPTPGALGAQAAKLLGNPITVAVGIGVLLFIATRSSRR